MRAKDGRWIAAHRSGRRARKCSSIERPSAARALQTRSADAPVVDDTRSLTFAKNRAKRWLK
jgi:hypothetical protein